jgi:hypothetical protein
VLWFFNIKKLGLLRPLLAAGFLVLSFLPVLFWNQILFGAPLNGGYPEMNSSISDLAFAGSSIAESSLKGNISNIVNGLKAVSATIFHFGIDYDQSFIIFKAYVSGMFYWIFWPAIFGLLLFIIKFRKLKKRHLIYLGCIILISFILVLYYGSWEFYDNPNKLEKTIGNSYTRYWLPLYLGLLPFASICILAYSRIFKKASFYRIAFLTLIILSSYAVSINYLMFGSSEGLAVTARKNMDSRKEYVQIMELTENNSVIITRYHDKLFFPERKVIVGEFDDPNMIREYAKLTTWLPVYYYNFSLPKKALDYLNTSKFKEDKLTINKVSQITNDFTLYKLEKK